MSTITKTFEIINKRGLHARASSKFATLAGSFEGANVRVAKDGEDVCGDSIMDLMMLGAGIGSSIEVSAEGENANAALDAIEALLADKFGEGE